MKKRHALKHGNKTETLRRLSQTVFYLEESQGHLAWKVTDLGRKSKVSRSLIYQYLGSTKKEILTSAFNNFVNEFYGFDGADNKKSMPEQIESARQKMILNPEAILFYQKWRAKDSWLQKKFIEIETNFQTSLKIRFPNLSGIQIISLHAMIHGLVTSPFLTALEAREIFSTMAERLN